MTQRTHKRLFAVVVLMSLTAVFGCNGNSPDSSPISSALPPMVPPAAPPPMPPAVSIGDIQFTVDNSVTESKNIAFEGGELALDVPGGGLFTLSVPNASFFAETTQVTMQSIVDTQGLPPGLTPIAAINLGPSGAVFALQPILEIDLRGLSKPTGNIVIFLANDDGTGLTYLVPEADDEVAVVLGDGPYRARVPHFSGIGVAVSDPNGPGLPDVDISANAEDRARQALNKSIEDQAREVIMGQRMLGQQTAGLDPIIADWYIDLSRRVNELNDDSILDEFELITSELSRFLQTERTLNASTGMSNLEEDEVGATIVQKFATQVQTWDERCRAGNANASDRIRDRIAFLRRLLSAELIGESTFRSIDQPIFCMPTGA